VSIWFWHTLMPCNVYMVLAYLNALVNRSFMVYLLVIEARRFDRFYPIFYYTFINSFKCTELF